MMRSRSKNNCKSASHRIFKDRAKNRVDDLQGMLLDLQFARKESRTIDVTVLEEQVHQMLREWKAELNEPSPASSLQQGGTLGSFSSDICRLLQLRDEEDDASSKLAAPKPEPADLSLKVADGIVTQGGYNAFQEKSENGFLLVDDCKESLMGTGINYEENTHFDCHQFNLEREFEQDFNMDFSNFTGLGGEHVLAHNSTYLPTICLPPSAFLGPKCALWDCPRPAQGLDWFRDYCSSFHACLAFDEGPPGMSPVVRPGGIGLKDGLLFAALSAKAQGKDVGIPECEGAATAKSPWNAPALFDLAVLEGETIREWLFFDKPRRAFESGNRKQRSLPDYSGRGWHESRKQIMNEFGGLKRSYYMDPQPSNHFEWHLYEYEISKCDACALYRLELKLVEGKKNSKGKISNSVADLQKQMGRLTAELPSDNKSSGKSMMKMSGKAANVNVYPSPDGKYAYGFGPEVNYLVGNVTDYYIT